MECVRLFIMVGYEVDDMWMGSLKSFLHLRLFGLGGRRSLSVVFSKGPLDCIRYLISLRASNVLRYGRQIIFDEME